MAELDRSNFSSSSPHRLPTVSASQALQNLTSSPYKPIPTGLKQLDGLLQGRISGGVDDRDSAVAGGLSRGHLTEVYGPPGVGKTTFALQLCANALRSGDWVLWIDCSFPVVGSRLQEILSSLTVPESSETALSMKELLDHLHHFATPTLPHLLALLFHPTPNFPPDKTSLIIIDSLSTVFAAAFPRATDISDGKQATGKMKETIHWASSRRWSVMGDFVARLSKLAVTRNIAVLLTNQTTTKIRPDTGAVLRSAMHGPSWDAGISTRIVLFRDWALRPGVGDGEGGSKMQAVRYAGVVKARGAVYGHGGGVGKIVPFTITGSGLQELESIPPGTDIGPLPILSGPSLKRKREEVSDSQSEDEQLGSDEEFGWVDDVDLPPEGLMEHNDNTGHNINTAGYENAGDIDTGDNNIGNSNTGNNGR